MLTYDEDSNITGVVDNVLINDAKNRSFDVKYDIDGLNRVTKADEGTLSGTISNRSREQEWLLTQTGNWAKDQLDLDGDLNYNETGEWNDSRTHNVANEITGRDLDSNAGTTGNNYSLTHDAVGNLTDDAKDYKYAYDVFNRLVTITNQSNYAVARYTYNGLGYRESATYDDDHDNDVDGSDTTRFYLYDERWRMVEGFRESDTYPTELNFYHNAGLGGYGGSSYIDSVILGDKETDGNWTSAADSGLDERLYYCQNWRADVSALITDTGELAERAKYSAYGLPFGVVLGDADGNGVVNKDDEDLVAANHTSGHAYVKAFDLDLDNDVDSADDAIANANSGHTGGRGVLSGVAFENCNGFAGYEHDGTQSSILHIRLRTFNAALGRWHQRDPVGYIDGQSLYEYSQSRPIAAVDYLGADCTTHTMAVNWGFSDDRQLSVMPPVFLQLGFTFGVTIATTVCDCQPEGKRAEIRVSGGLHIEGAIGLGYTLPSDPFCPDPRGLCISGWVGGRIIGTGDFGIEGGGEIWNSCTGNTPGYVEICARGTLSLAGEIGGELSIQWHGWGPFVVGVVGYIRGTVWAGVCFKCNDGSCWDTRLSTIGASWSAGVRVCTGLTGCFDILQTDPHEWRPEIPIGNTRPPRR